MAEIDFDEIFDEFEDAHALQREFMAFFQEVVHGGSIKFVLETGEEICPPGGEAFPGVTNLDAIIDKIKQNSPDFVWLDNQDSMIAGTYVPTLKGAILYAEPGQKAEQILLGNTLRAALKYSLAKFREKELVDENEQLHRQTNVLKQQHGELVENNHRQYLQLQNREKEYAKQLESEIAKQTAELRRKNEELIESSRLKSEFLANMSHELRTPMNAIIGFSELLVETELNQVQADYAETIKQSGSGLLSLINDILDFAKIEADKLDIDNHPFKLSDIVKNVGAMFQKSATAKGIAFHCSLDEKLPVEFVGDGNRLKQVLINLSGNALKFTDKGEIEIRADLTRREGDQVTVYFSVRDTGTGIAKDRQAAIFEKFVQEDGSTTRKFGGTGLGLAISSKLVALMGGNISLQSEVSKGSIFSFFLTLPCTEAQEEKRGGDQEERQPSDASQELGQDNLSATATNAEVAQRTVLLVEDNLVNQKLATVLIKKQGCEVVVAEDGLVALEKLKESRFDLILMDLQMPNMGGLEATKRIRAIEQSSDSSQYKGLQDPDHPVPIVGLSAHARKEDAEEGMAAGMNDFLTKPIVRAKLEAVLAKVGDG